MDSILTADQKETLIYENDRKRLLKKKKKKKEWTNCFGFALFELFFYLKGGQWTVFGYMDISLGTNLCPIHFNDSQKQIK